MCNIQIGMLHLRGIHLFERCEDPGSTPGRKGWVEVYIQISWLS